VEKIRHEFFPNPIHNIAIALAIATTQSIMALFVGKICKCSAAGHHSSPFVWESKGQKIIIN
jgi:hypothetical protein